MIESGRFKDLVIRGFHTELEAVYEEYNMRSSNDQGKVLLAINNILYPDIPYRQHEVIGTPEHLKNPSLINIKKFYNTYYRPNNVAICLSGDLDFDHAMDIIEEYFGDWEPNENLPKFSIPEQAPLAAAKDTVVYGQEAPMTWLGWTFPALNHEDMDVVTIIDAILQNGKVGFFDQLMQQQQILDAGEFCYPGNDYSTYLLIGIPKEGQSLKEVKDLMLAQVERLKAGDFSDELLTAIINNARKDQMVSLQSNNARDNVFLQSFIYDIPYADLVHEVDRLADITKDDVVRVAVQAPGQEGGPRQAARGPREGLEAQEAVQRILGAKLAQGVQRRRARRRAQRAGRAEERKNRSHRDDRVPEQMTREPGLLPLGS